MHDYSDIANDILQPPSEGRERDAFCYMDPPEFFIRHPPPPHQLGSRLTDEGSLFQTLHMGGAEVSADKWMLVVDGMVERPYAITLQQLRRMPSKTITSFVECYGSPLQPPTKALRRIGNASWTGVPLSVLLAIAEPKSEASFVWSEGLDRGKFAGLEADRYQKDLPMEKALSPTTLVVYEMNSQPLGKNRGGPVRLLVPGWFGTNSTKWLSKLSVQDRRAQSIFTTTFYNERNPPDDPACESRPVWRVQPNSMIVKPVPDAEVQGPQVSVEGWCWSHDPVTDVSISTDNGESWTIAAVEKNRKDFSWQRFRAELELPKGSHTLLARSQSPNGRKQPLGEGRNHVHRVNIEVI